MFNSLTLPARESQAIKLSKGQDIKIIEAFGPQVVDTWAFAVRDPLEFMSMEHSRSCLQKLTTSVSDSMYSNRRRPILTIVEDTTPGAHDMLLSACDAERYRLLGHCGPHATCADNFAQAIATSGLDVRTLPSPWNLFENVEIRPDCSLCIRPPLAVAGDFIQLRAEMDLIIVLSACPMDIVPTNGSDCTPKAVLIELL